MSQPRSDRYRGLPTDNFLQMLANDIDELERESMEDREWIRQEFQSSRKVYISSTAALILCLFGAVLTFLLK